MIRRNVRQKPEKKRQNEKKVADIRKKRSMIDLRREPAGKAQIRGNAEKKTETASREKITPEQKARILMEREVRTLQTAENRKFMIMWSSIGFIMILLITVWIFQFKSLVKSSIPSEQDGGASSSMEILQDSLGEMKENLSALEKVKEDISDFRAALDSSASSSLIASSSAPAVPSETASSTQLRQESQKLMDEFEMKLNGLEPSGASSSPEQSSSSAPVL